MPANSEVTVATGAILDLNGHAQSLTSLSGGGLVTNGTLTVNGLIAPGGIDSVGTLTIASKTTQMTGSYVQVSDIHRATVKFRCFVNRFIRTPDKSKSRQEGTARKHIVHR
jgi:hypothetical protein